MENSFHHIPPESPPYPHWGAHTGPTDLRVQVRHNLILLSTNKIEQNKPCLGEDIVAYLASIVVCYNHCHSIVD